jgi:hypothetical protein
MKRLVSVALATAVIASVLSVASPASAATCSLGELGGGTGGWAACADADNGYYVIVPCWDGANISTRYSVNGQIETDGSWSIAYCAWDDWKYPYANIGVRVL